MSSKVLGGLGTLYEPTSARPYYRAAFTNQQGKRQFVSGKTEAETLDNLRDALQGKTNRTPTLQEVFDSWIDANRSKWVDRTVVVYNYRFQHLKHLANRPVSTINPSELKNITDGISREQAKRVRSIVSAVFKESERWTKKPASDYVLAVKLPGSKSDERRRKVSKDVIPSPTWVKTVIDLCYASFQTHPLATDPVDPITGYQPNYWEVEPGFETAMSLPHIAFQQGLPPELLNKLRRGVPKHYKNVEQRRTAETIELAGRMRQTALITALGAGVGLRIGEVLALRPRHLFDQSASLHAELHKLFHNDSVFGEAEGQFASDPFESWNYRGKIEVVEQVSPLATGQMNITAPKGNKPRTVWLPALLYPTYGLTRDTLRQELNRHMVVSETQPLWTLNHSQLLKAWDSGFIPVSYILYQRLRDIWFLEAKEDPEQFLNSLLFPTRNFGPAKTPPRFPETWKYQKVPTVGTFQSPTNLTTRYIAPIYDYVSLMLNEKPTRGGRGGYTHHSLRHLCVSQWISRGVPVPVVSQQAGHANQSFTLDRYAAAILEGVSEHGFEG